ncbi:hypothetical protein KR222_002451 [Zaprionus bogoriensis]|nr:hypothetical protein KR222_002451 [Zaprionus bogoriensis]
MYRSRQEQEQSQDADESFDAFERMCDRTASDPDSTLFQYMHSEDKELVLAQAKERSARSDKSGDLELEALQRMLCDVSCQDQLANESPLKSPDCTQLEDVEPPSRFWNNDTILGAQDSALQLQPTAKTSPVKLVGLLRPSTILETSEADVTAGCQSDESAHSFRTAGTLKTSIGSSCYETATGDNSLASSCKRDSAVSTLNVDVDDLFYAAIAKAKPHGMSRGEQQELLCDLHETLIDLAETQQPGNANESTIIEISSSEDEQEQEQHDELDIKQEQASLMEQHDSLLEDDDDDDKENNKSMQFNDTIEEMEYMMQKGLEYMAAAASGAAAKAISVANTPTKSTPTANTKQPLSSVALPKQQTFVLSPKSSPRTPHQQSGSKPERRYAIEMDKPQSKFFKTPTAIPMRRQLKPHKDQFAHIVSPIRAYTQKSGTAPLMSMFRQKENVKDVFNMLGKQELEQEARLCRLKLTQAAAAKHGSFNPLKTHIDGIDAKSRLLPKKAYISSELKQIVDKRTPAPMPNVPRIQKYLNAAVEPTVLRHDGKLKLSEQNGGGVRLSHIPRPPAHANNQSLADLSLASGDISLYTIKDAQKF